MTTPVVSSPQPLALSGVILPGTGTSELFIADGLIVDSRPAGARTLARDCWVLPGLVDAHCHIGMGLEGAVPYEVAVAQAITDRNAGTLLVRDAGCPQDTHWIDQRADLPRIVRAGRHIARTTRYIRNLANEIEPDQLVEQVELQARAGDGWVKIVGDWIDRSVGDLAPSWPADVAARAIARVHELGARITAHCFGEQSVAELVAAGIDCIEHGTGMTPEVIDQMAAQGTALVPTMTNLENFPHYAEQGGRRFPRYQTHMLDLYARRLETLSQAREAGVAIYCGTDAGTVVPHGQAPREINLLATIGSTEFALGAGSWRARSWLGHPNLEVGASADLVVYSEDPRVHPETLLHPAAVILRGVQVA